MSYQLLAVRPSGLKAKSSNLKAHKYMIKLSGVAIIDTHGKLLLLHHIKHNHYQFPGGKVEESESAEETAIRESKEEIGCKVEILKCLIQDRFKHNKKQFEQHVFLAKIKENQTPKVMEAEVFDELIWFKMIECESFSRTLAPNVLNFCEKVSQKKIDI